LTSVWNLLPEDSRSALVAELEALCRDAKIVDGQEPLDSLYDSAFFVDLPAAVEVYDANAQSREPSTTERSEMLFSASSVLSWEGTNDFLWPLMPISL
jgi:hypothetical protein